MVLLHYATERRDTVAAWVKDIIRALESMAVTIEIECEIRKARNTVSRLRVDHSIQRFDTTDLSV